MATSHVLSAPDQLGLVQALINSNDLESGRDALETPASMRDWLASQRLASPSGAYDEADRRRLVELRDALQELAAANSGGHRPRRAVTALNEAARRVRLGVRFHPEDGYRVDGRRRRHRPPHRRAAGGGHGGDGWTRRGSG